MAAEAAAHPHVEVHVVSFPVLKQPVGSLSSQLKFHPLDKATVEMLQAPWLSKEDLPHPPMAKSFKPYHWNFPLILGLDGEYVFFVSSATDGI